MAQDRPRAESDVFAVLELLVNEAPTDHFEALVEQAQRRGVAGERLEALKSATRLGSAVQAQVDRRRKREDDLSALVDTARELVTQSDLQTLLLVITRRARLLLSVDMAYLSLPDEEDGYVRVSSADGHTSTRVVGARLPADGGLGGAVLSESAPFWTPDYLADERIAHTEAADDVIKAEGLRAILGVPLSSGTRPFGTLYVGHRKVRRFTAGEISLLSSLGDLAGVTIEKAQLLALISGTAVRWEQHASRAETELRTTREFDDIHNGLLELVLSGGDLYTLAEEASERLGGGLRVCAPDGTVITTAGGMPDEGGTAVAVATMDAHAAREPVRLDTGMWAAPIFAGNENLGTLLVRPEDRLIGEDVVLRLVAQVTAVSLLLERTKTTLAESQARDELFDDLLAAGQRPQRKLGKHARRLGIDLDKPHVVVVARAEGKLHGKASIWASSYAHRLGGLKSMHDGRAVLLLPGTDAGAAARAVSGELSSLLSQPVTAGAAGPITGPGSIRNGYQEALRCLEAISALGPPGRSASARELGFLGVLLSDDRDVDGFIESAIGPVLDHDRERFAELAHTLGAYFDAGSSPKYAAEKLHVHPNTVARRLERITELLGPEWHRPERALDIQLALRLSRIRHALGEDQDA